MGLDDILKQAVEKGASDVHLKVGVQPVIRRNGTLRPLNMKDKPLEAEELVAMARQIMDASQWERFEKDHSIDLAYGIAGVGRFRASIFMQRGTVRLVIRNVPHRVPSYDDLSLPDTVKKLSQLERGLVLVTGITGSGKSSTLAAIINDINHRYNKHILTVEDPIEFLIRDRKSLVTQREIGLDAFSFTEALRSGLRQDPDVILIGEIRDKETIDIALQAAETGHLVLSTLHTMDATETVNRVIGAFETDRQEQVRLRLGAMLRAVVSQRLCAKKSGDGFVPAVELMINTGRIRELIEDPEKTQDIAHAIEEGQSAWGMQSFDQSLMELLDKDLITLEEALIHSTKPEDFRVRLQGVMAMDGKKWSQSGAAKDHAPDWNAITEVEIDLPTLLKKQQKKSS